MGNVNNIISPESRMEEEVGNGQNIGRVQST